MTSTQGTAPLTLAFTNTSTGDNLTHYWDFGDGNTSTLQNPTHTYVTAGFYSCILTVTNENGRGQASQPIVVNAAGSGGNGYGDGKDVGNGDVGPPYKGYPSYEAWYAAQKGGGDQGPLKELG
jgi:PKD repeat protein